MNFDQMYVIKIHHHERQYLLSYCVDINVFFVKERYHHGNEIRISPVTYFKKFNYAEQALNKNILLYF